MFLSITHRLLPSVHRGLVPLLCPSLTPHKVIWTDACEQAFTKFKELLCSTPILMSSDFESLIVVQTDASEQGVGDVLSQQDDDGDEHPMAYWSRKLLPCE